MSRPPRNCANVTVGPGSDVGVPDESGGDEHLPEDVQSVPEDPGSDTHMRGTNKGGRKSGQRATGKPFRKSTRPTGKRQQQWRNEKRQ